MSTAIARPGPTEIVSPYDDVASSPVDGIGTLAAFNNAGIDIQIATAHRFPRAISKFMAEAQDLITANRQVAAACIYAIPRGGKTITGPSIRMAELCQYAWGNIRTAAMITGDDGRFVTATSICLDLQKNSGYQVEARRRITDKTGKRFDDDMIAVTSNATISLSLRNGIFRIIPRTYIDALQDLARQVAGGKVEELEQLRGEWLDFFAKKGIGEKDVYRILEIAGPLDMTNEHLATLQGFQTSVKEKVTTWEDIFAPPKEKPLEAAQAPAGATKAEKLASRLKTQQSSQELPMEPGSAG